MGRKALPKRFGGKIITFHGQFVGAQLRHPKEAKYDKWMLNRVKTIINRHGTRARRITQNKNHTPYLTGDMMKSISWKTARIRGKEVSGMLIVGTPYGRRQEYEHPTKAFFLLRAMLKVDPDIRRSLNSPDLLDGIIFDNQVPGEFKTTDDGKGTAAGDIRRLG